jgi:hypothetical protein
VIDNNQKNDRIKRKNRENIENKKIKRKIVVILLTSILITVLLVKSPSSEQISKKFYND